MDIEFSHWLERKAWWIAVTDANPKDGEPVIVSDKCGNIVMGWLVKGRWFHATGVFEAGEVTHWMEEPTPPDQFELNRVAEALAPAAKE